MMYRSLKSFIIVATVLVWARLLFGTVEFLNGQTPEFGNNEVVATEQPLKDLKN